MHEPATFVRLFVVLILIAAFGPSASAQLVSPPGWFSKLDTLLQQRASLSTGQSRVIVRAVDARSLGSVITMIQQAGGTSGRQLPLVNGQVATVPNASLPMLASSPLVQHLSLDRVLAGAMERTGRTVAATAIRQELGYDGSGVGVAIIDSGVTSWHDDLTGPAGAQRIERFVDLVNGHQTVYDDYGHGTHIAGIIAGNGFDSGGKRSGIAPAASLIVLKTLDGSGRGRISDVIAALADVVAHKDTLNIRVVNLSIATGVYESYNADPLTLAAQRVVAAGIVVVAAAGNSGRNPQGLTQYGGITAPGNAPWVLTVGASSHLGTVDRGDDTVAAFSSRGPGAIDYVAKPDVVAPGVGIESLSDPNSSFYATKSSYLLTGSASTSYLPYLSLSGTSMATPVVSGTVALMLQANPALTPNQVKAILQYTAQVYSGHDRLTQGAGFLNAKGAVELAEFFAAAPNNNSYPSSPEWSAQLIWGNHLVRGGRPTADANAWSTEVTWGASTTPGGQDVEWGEICTRVNCDTAGGTRNRWGTRCLNKACSSVPWSNANSQNVVWGSTCGGADCQGAWSPVAAGGAVTATSNGDTVVWGNSSGDTVVWGTGCDAPSCQPVVWKNR
jgi:serine protease AprX